MRIVFTVPNYFPRVTGPGRSVAAIAQHLARGGHGVCIVTTTPDSVDSGLHGGPQVMMVKDAGATRAPSGLGELLGRIRPEVVVCHEVRNGLARATLQWALKRGVRVALQPHGGLTAVPHLPSLLQRFPYHLHDVLFGGPYGDERVEIVASSLSEERDLRSRIGVRRRIVRLYLGADVKDHPARHSKPDATHIVMVANLGTFRDPRWAIRASALLAERGRTVRLTIAGPLQPQSRFGHRLRADDLAGADYLGPLGPERLSELYASGDVFCYPTRYESFGLPVLEAALHGLPLVTGPFGIAPELALGEAGRFVRAHDPRELAAALGTMIDDLPGARKRARERARALRRWAPWERRADAYLHWLESGEAVPDSPPSESDAG